MSTKHRPQKIKSILSVACWILILLLFSSCRRNTRISNEDNLSIQQLLDGLTIKHDVAYYDKLWMRSDCPWDEFVFASLFAGDSLHFLRGYEMLADCTGEMNAELFYSAILIAHKEHEFYSSFSHAFPFKNCITQWVMKGHDKFCVEYVQNTDSLLNMMLEVEDDSSYMTLRENIPYEKLSHVAKLLADEKGLASAACDVYLSYISSTYKYLADSANADTALYYLENSADHQFLPAVFYKSLLLLTGTYLPQDTIAGRELFLNCIDSTDCIPFWRGKILTILP